MEGAVIKNWFDELYKSDQRKIIKIQIENKLYHPTMYTGAVDFFLDAYDGVPIKFKDLK